MDCRRRRRSNLEIAEMSRPDFSTISRVCDLLLRESFARAVSTLHLDPKDGGYVVMAVSEGRTEQVMAPPQGVSLGMFVHLCQRADVANDICEGRFEFPYGEQVGTVELSVINRPQGKRAVLTLLPS